MDNSVRQTKTAVPKGKQSGCLYQKAFAAEEGSGPPSHRYGIVRRSAWSDQWCI